MENTETRKQKPPPVDLLFNEISNGSFLCITCRDEGVNDSANIVSSARHNDTNLRKHMWTRHSHPEFMYESTRKQMGIDESGVLYESGEQKDKC